MAVEGRTQLERDRAGRQRASGQVDQVAAPLRGRQPLDLPEQSAIGVAGEEPNLLEGLGAIEADAAGCIILDVRLPDRSGLELQVALVDRAITLPIVFMTGHGQIPDTVRAIQRGAVDFLTKPVDGNVLLAAVSRALAQDSAARAARSHQQDLRSRYERLTARERWASLSSSPGWSC